MKRAELIDLIKRHPNAGKVALTGMHKLPVGELEHLLDRIQEAHADVACKLAQEQQREEHRRQVNEICGEPVYEERAPLGPGTRLHRDILWSLANAFSPIVYEIENLRLIRMAYDRWQRVARAAETGMRDGIVTHEDADEAFEEMVCHIRRVHLDRTILAAPDLNERRTMIELLCKAGYQVTGPTRDTTSK